MINVISNVIIFFRILVVSWFLCGCGRGRGRGDVRYFFYEVIYVVSSLVVIFFILVFVEGFGYGV